VSDSGLSPAGHGDLGRAIRNVWLAYLRGQLLMALIMGLVTWGVSAALGLRFAWLIGLIAGILETVPNFGPILAAAIAAVVAAIWGSGVLDVPNWAFALIVIAAFFVLQQLESLLLSPYITGRQVEMHPLLVLVSVIAGGLIGAALIPLVGGVIGAYLAVPVVATVRVIYRHLQAGR
jgi:predicted PurR-regulated permease PerM